MRPPATCQKQFAFKQPHRRKGENAIEIQDLDAPIRAMLDFVYGSDNIDAIRP